MTTITLASVEHAIAKTGNAMLKITDIKNDFYTCFEPALFPVLTAGATVQVEVEVKNNYRRITAAERATMTPGRNAPVVQSSDRDERIQSQVALKAAVEYGSAVQMSVDDILALADRFNEWLDPTLF